MSKLDFSTTRPHVEPEPSRELRKSDRTRTAILDAALEFLWDHPFREMTVVTGMTPTGRMGLPMRLLRKELLPALNWPRMATSMGGLSASSPSHASIWRFRETM